MRGPHIHQFKQRQKIKKMVYSWPVIVILLILFAFVFRGTLGVFQKYRLSSEALEISNAKQTELMAKKKSVESDVAHIETRSGMEEEMRIQFNVAKEGEQTIVILEEEKVETEDEQEKSVWQKITSWFSKDS